MRLMSTITIGLATVTLLFVGCGEAKQEAMPVKESVVKTTAPIKFVSEESLGLRKTNLYSEKTETQGHKAEYSTSYTGSGVKIKRAFQDAPPMIPHDVEGLLPITINNNQCLGCHMPEEAAAMGMGATPIPVSHFINFRPSSSAIKGENTSSETLSHVSIKKSKKLYGGRFNCSQCHAPQSGDDLAVKNTFEADYTSADGASKSTWNGTKLMEGINTYESSK